MLKSKLSHVIYDNLLKYPDVVEDIGYCSTGGVINKAAGYSHIKMPVTPGDLLAFVQPSEFAGFGDPTGLWLLEDGTMQVFLAGGSSIFSTVRVPDNAVAMYKTIEWLGRSASLANAAIVKVDASATSSIPFNCIDKTFTRYDKVDIGKYAVIDGAGKRVLSFGGAVMSYLLHIPKQSCTFANLWSEGRIGASPEYYSMLFVNANGNILANVPGAIGSNTFYYDVDTIVPPSDAVYIVANLTQTRQTVLLCDSVYNLDAGVSILQLRNITDITTDIRKYGMICSDMRAATLLANAAILPNIDAKNYFSYENGWDLKIRHAYFEEDNNRYVTGVQISGRGFDFTVGGFMYYNVDDYTDTETMTAKDLAWHDANYCIGCGGCTANEDNTIVKAFFNGIFMTFKLSSPTRQYDANNVIFNFSELCGETALSRWRVKRTGGHVLWRKNMEDKLELHAYQYGAISDLYLIFKNVVFYADMLLHADYTSYVLFDASLNVIANVSLTNYTGVTFRGEDILAEYSNAAYICFSWNTAVEYDNRRFIAPYSDVYTTSGQPPMSLNKVVIDNELSNIKALVNDALMLNDIINVGDTLADKTYQLSMTPWFDVRTYDKTMYLRGYITANSWYSMYVLRPNEDGSMTVLQKIGYGKDGNPAQPGLHLFNKPLVIEPGNLLGMFPRVAYYLSSTSKSVTYGYLNTSETVEGESYMPKDTRLQLQLDLKLLYSDNDSQVLMDVAVTELQQRVADIEHGSTGPTDLTKVVTIANSDKIAFYGCSYTESYYALQGKSWVNKLSNALDMQCANFGVSGNRIVDICKRLRQNANPYHGSVGIKELQPTYIAIQNIGNETLHTSGGDLDLYLGEVAEAAELVKSYGAEVILANDWMIGNRNIDALLSDYARLHGYRYYPIGTISQTMLANKYPGFWGGDHPATRSNATIWQEYLQHLRNLPVHQCIKLYRPRAEYKSGSPSIQDLNYDTVEQRQAIWQEINVGEIHLANTSPGFDYYDRLNERSGSGWAYKATKATNEYCKLINKEAVGFNKFALAEFILPVVKPDKVTVKVKSVHELQFYVKDSADTAYQYSTARNFAMFKVDKAVYDAFADIAENTEFVASADTSVTLQYKGRFKGTAFGGYYLNMYNKTNDTALSSSSAGTLTTGSTTYNYMSINYGLGRHSDGFYDSCLQPLANFAAINAVYADGVYTIDITDYAYMQYDKLRLIIGSAADFNITDVYCTVDGGLEKVSNRNSFVPVKQGGKQLMSDTGFGTQFNDAVSLTDGATFATIPSAINEYPSLHTAYKSCIELGYDDEQFAGKATATFDIEASRGYRHVLVKAVARMYPKVYNTTKQDDDVYTTVQQITPTSFDLGTLCVGIGYDSNVLAVERRLVDVGWAELEIRALVPPYVDTLTVSLWRDESDLQLTDYNVKDWPMQLADLSIELVD